MKLSPLAERRIIYLVLFLAVMLPLLFPIGWKTESSAHVRMAHNLVDKMPAGTVAIISFDYDPASMTELQPMAEAMIEHAWSKGHKIIATALWPQGPQLADQAFRNVMAKYPGKVYGEDYVNLGYKVGGMVTIQAMGRSMAEIYPTDTSGMQYKSIPILAKITTIKDIAYIASMSSGDPGIKQWIMAAHDMFGVPVTGGTTAISAPGFIPYINSQNQLIGLLGGLKAAAEYESLIGVDGPATAKMDSQSVAHLLILIFIAIGNIKVFLAKKKARKVNIEEVN